MRARLSGKGIAPVILAGAIAMAVGPTLAAAAPPLGLGSLPLPSPPGLSTLIPATPVHPALPSMPPALPAVTALPRATATPAPEPSAAATSASGTGVRIDPLDTCVSCTSTSAGAGSGSAGAAALRVLGTTLVGDPQPATSGSGSLLSLTSNPFVAVAVADWANAVSAAHGDRSSHARASLFDMRLDDGRLATVAILESFSDSSWSAAASSSSSSSNGVHAEVFDGALAIVILHSESSSAGGSSVYLLGLNGTVVHPASNGRGSRTLSVPAVTSVVLLQTSAADATRQAGSSSIATIANTVPWVLGTGETGVILASQATATPASAAGGSGGPGGGGGSGGSGGAGSGGGGGSGGAGGGGVSGAGATAGDGRSCGASCPGAAVPVAAGGLSDMFGALSTPLTGAGVRLYGLILIAAGMLAIAWSRHSRPRRAGRAALQRIA